MKRSLPLTSATVGSFTGQDSGTLIPVAACAAEHLEESRRNITWGGALLCIPATMGFALAVAAAAGFSGMTLALCALVGLTAGPGVCCWALAVSHVVGQPATRRLFMRRAYKMGLSPAQAKEAWVAACRRLDEAERHRWTSRGRRDDDFSTLP